MNRALQQRMWGDHSPIEMINGETGPALQHFTVFGGPQRVTAGEQTAWLMPILNEGKLTGAKCPVCQQVLAPAYARYCTNPRCRFAKLELVQLADTGIVMEADPIITVFPPSSMHGLAPFAHGQVYLHLLDEGGQPTDQLTTTAMMFPMDTTTGIIRPGVLKAGMTVKICFKDPKDRIGAISDCLALAQSELPDVLLERSPLLISDINWISPRPLEITADPALAEDFQALFLALEKFAGEVNHAPKAAKAMAEQSFTLNMLSAGGCLFFTVEDGSFIVSRGSFSDAMDIVLTGGQQILWQWKDGYSLIDAFMSGGLWMPNRSGIHYLTVLDRFHRAVRRSQ